MAFCVHCGNALQPQAVVCVRCGAAAAPLEDAGYAEQREWLTMVLLCFFLGVFGVHRFYSGHRLTGILQLLTVGGCGIWWTFDFITILVGSFRDADGRPLLR